MFAKSYAWMVSLFCLIITYFMITNGQIVSGLGVFIASLFAMPIIYKKLADNVRKDAEAKGKEPVVMGYFGAATTSLSVAIMIGVFSLGGSDEQTTEKATVPGIAQPYRILKISDTSFPGRSRRSISIMATAPLNSVGDRAYTVIQAAKDVVKKSNAEAITVILEIDPALSGTGNHWARVHYIPDGWGFSGKEKSPVWQVYAVQKAPDLDKIKWRLLWEEHRAKFIDKTGLLDEEKLKAFLAPMVGVTPEEFTLPFIHPEAFAYEGKSYDVAQGTTR